MVYTLSYQMYKSEHELGSAEQRAADVRAGRRPPRCGTCGLASGACFTGGPSAGGLRARRRGAGPRRCGSCRVAGKGDDDAVPADPRGRPDLDDAWNDDAWAALNAWLDEAIGSGVSIEGAPLRLDADATTVKVRDGQLIVTDGPYAETKEQVAGYDVIEAASLEEAVGWARRHPHAWMGSVEVRALAGGSPVVHLPEPPAAGRTRYMMLVCTDPAVDSGPVEPVEPWVAEMEQPWCPAARE